MGVARLAAMSMGPDIAALHKLCKRSISPMADGEALVLIAELVDSSFEASFERGPKRALFLFGEVGKRPLSDKDGSLIEYLLGSDRIWVESCQC